MKHKKILSMLLAFTLTFTSIIFNASSAFAATGGYSQSYANSKYYSQLKAWKLTGNQAKDICFIAQSQLGYTGSGTAGNFSGNGSGKVTPRYTEYMRWVANGNGSGNWCAAFISWCADQAGISSSVIPKTASPAGLCIYGKNGWAKYNPNDIRCGDLVLLDNGAHVGLVYAVNGTTIYTFEGNMTNSVKGLEYNKSTGICSYSKMKITGYIHPKYKTVSNGGTTTTPAKPGKPVIKDTFISGNRVVISWNRVANAQKYDVYLVQAPWGWGDIKYQKSVSSNQSSCTFEVVEKGKYNAFIIARPNDNTVQSKWVPVVIEHCAHNYVVESERAHPHKEYKRCLKCGYTYYTGKDFAGQIKNCEECFPKCVHNYVFKIETAHPHKNYYYCTKCFDTYDISNERYVADCQICNPFKGTAPKLTLSVKNNVITAKWKKVGEADGYQLQRSTQKSGKFSTIAKGTILSNTSKKLNYNKKYYYRIRTYKEINGKKVYGKWSSVASIKTTKKVSIPARNRAYADYLAKHPAKSYDYGAGYRPKDTSYINSYVLYDVDKNGTKELVTWTGINFRASLIRIYEYDNGKVKPYTYQNGKKAVFDLSSEANGSKEFFICKKGHIHVNWWGYVGFKETVYIVKDHNLTKYLYRNKDTFMPENIAKKYGEEISISTYDSLIKDCSRGNYTFCKNTKSNRAKLRK